MENTKKATPALPKEKKTKPQSGTGRKAAIALLCAVAVFIALVAVERSMTSVPTVSVLMATTEVPAGLAIDEGNVAQFFVAGTINAATAPATAFTKSEELVGKITATQFDANEVATPGRFTAASENLTGIANPVEVSVAVSSSGYADGGRIRAGDRVNIGYIPKSEDSKEYVEILQNVYVVSAMDSAGAAALSEGDGVVSTMFSLAVSKADAEKLYSNIELGAVAVHKVSD